MIECDFFIIVVTSLIASTLQFPRSTEALTTNIIEEISSENAFELAEACNYVDIRFEKKNFDQLENCRVVLNGLKISDIEDDLSDLSFPRLTEITGYLMINNVSSLKALVHLFPHLTVIRGNILLHGASVIITNNKNLEEIGISSLTSVYDKKLAAKNLKIEDAKIIFQNNPKFNEKIMTEFSKNNLDDELFFWMEEKSDEACSVGSRATNTCAVCEYLSKKECLNCPVTCHTLDEEHDFGKVKFNNFYLISEELCRKMKFHPIDLKCLTNCQHNLGHFYDETSESCNYVGRELLNYCNHSIVVDGLASLFSIRAENCTMVQSVIIRNIPFNTSVDIQGRLKEIFGRLADIKNCLIIENSPGITSLHFMPYFASVRENCTEFGYARYSIVIRGNENLHEFFSQGIILRKGGIQVQNNSALCKEELINWIAESKNAKNIFDLQTSECDVPVMKFNILQSFGSILILIDRLKDELDYKLFYYEKNKKVAIKDIKLEKDFHELSLIPNRIYEIFIKAKKQNEHIFKFKSSSKEIKVWQFQSFLNITSIKTSTNSVEIYWENLNEVENVFFLIHIDRNQSAEIIRKGWTHENRCSLKIKTSLIKTGYDKFYFRPLPLPSDSISFIVEKATNFTIHNLLPAHCYSVNIYLCFKGNVRRCSESTSKIILTDEIPEIYVMSPVQKIMVVVVLFVTIGTYVLIRMFHYFRKIQKRAAAPLDPDTPLLKVITEKIYDFNVEVLQSLIDGDYEIKKEDIERGDSIGCGFFGEVFEGKYIVNNVEMRVAVKTIKEADKNYQKFIQEASLIKTLQTHHIVKLIGFVLKREPWIVMEFMENKDLRKFLRENKPSESETAPMAGYVIQDTNFIIKMRSFYDMGVEIADGMAYLAFNKCVHRDLAARNCMVAADMTIKIGDFGMSRDIYNEGWYMLPTNHQQALPIAHMAPESLKKGLFSEKSDVWSFGIVLWEILTYGEQPFAGYPDEVVNVLVRDGFTPQMPENCDDDIKNLINSCWRKIAKQRITFREIVEFLLPLITHLDNFKQVSFYHQNYHQ